MAAAFLERNKPCQNHACAATRIVLPVVRITATTNARRAVSGRWMAVRILTSATLNAMRYGKTKKQGICSMKKNARKPKNTGTTQTEKAKKTELVFKMLCCGQLLMPPVNQYILRKTKGKTKVYERSRLWRNSSDPTWPHMIEYLHCERCHRIQVVGVYAGHPKFQRLKWKGR